MLLYVRLVLFIVPAVLIMAIFCLIWIVRLIRSFFAKGQGKTYSLDSFIFMMLYFSLIGFGTSDDYIRHIQMGVCTALWTISLICAIIQFKVSKKKTWNEILEEHMRGLIEFCNVLRSMLLRGAQWWKQLNIRIKQGIFITWLALLIISGLQKNINLMAFSLLSFAIAAFLLNVYNCLSSCKALLSFWVMDGLCVVGIFLLYIMPFFPQDALYSSVLDYGIFCFCLLVFWIISAGIADYDVAKMATQVVNTITTILLLTANVLFIWCKNNIFVPLAGWDWETLIDWTNLFLLPFVISGYLAALFADGKYYIEEKLKRKEKDNQK